MVYLILYNGSPLPPTSKFPLPMGIWTPIEYMVPLAHPCPQPKGHLNRFSHFPRACDRDRQTDRQTHRQTDTQTDHATPSVIIGCIYLCSTKMQLKNGQQEISVKKKQWKLSPFFSGNFRWWGRNWRTRMPSWQRAGPRFGSEWTSSRLKTASSPSETTSLVSYSNKLHDWTPSCSRQCQLQASLRIRRLVLGWAASAHASQTLTCVMFITFLPNLVTSVTAIISRSFSYPVYSQNLNVCTKIDFSALSAL